MNWTLYPAIDVRGGRVVRLAQGDYARQTAYDEDPVALAGRYRDAGAHWLHLVDLDAARDGGYRLHGLLEQIKAATGLKVQTGGGVRREADVERLLAAGADRVVVGTIAIREPNTVFGWLQRFGNERLTIALDARRDEQGVWRLPVKGWTEVSLGTLEQWVERYAQADARHLLCTDIARDGMLGGFNLELYAMLRARWPGLAVQASGGAAAIDDVRAARGAGAAGAVLGRGLLDGRFELAEALAC